MIKSPAELSLAAKTLGGVPIWGVLPGTAAARAGVRYGDIEMRETGMEPRTLEDFIAAREASDGRVVFDVFREGELLRLNVHLATGGTLS